MSGNQKYKKYGKEPFGIFLVHGGPGAIGDLQPLAEHLSDYVGVVETFHSGNSINNQLLELFEAIVENTPGKVILIGHSWGAWQICLFASKYPEMVKKLILLCSGPFEAEYAEKIMEKRYIKLSYIEKQRLFNITSQIDSSGQTAVQEMMDQFRFLLLKADSFELSEEYTRYKCKLSMDVYNHIWPEAENLRRKGTLLDIVKKIKCPVLAIHGDCDSHPADGVNIPLMKILPCFRFELIQKCGHYPWFEKYAKDRFYEILLNEI